MTKIISVVNFFIIILANILICKKIENKNLKKNINILFSLLLLWIIIRIVKCEIIKDKTVTRILWYLYYFPILFSATIFLYIGTWHNKNKKSIKILKKLSVIGSSILLFLVMTNDFHKLVFKINFDLPNVEDDYKYGILYYFIFIWIAINIGISLASSIKYSKGSYKKQKNFILLIIILLVGSYAITYMDKTSIIYGTKYIRNFTLIYSISYMLALSIIVYKEKYRQTLEEQLYKQIELAIKDKTILINKKINEISKSKDKKRELAYIKMLVSYCKRKSNLIVLEKNQNIYTSTELELTIREIINDASALGIFGDVNFVNKFDIPIYVVSIVYAYIYNLFEYCNNYTNTNVLISVEKINDKININTIVDSKDILKDFEYDFEMAQFISNEKINVKQSIEDNCLNISLKIPINMIVLKEQNLTEKEMRALLEIKSKVHDILGQRLSVVSRIVEENNIKEDKIDEIKPLLKNILEDLDNDNIVSPNELLKQIVYTCELAGTKLYVVGELPKNYFKSLTIVKIIRECSTNAIRHGKAKNIYVKIVEKNKTEIIISNDGKTPFSFKEGDGIRGIKNRIEEQNGSLEIEPKNNFTIKVSI